MIMTDGPRPIRTMLIRMVLGLLSVGHKYHSPPLSGPSLKRRLWNEFVDISPLSDKISIHAGVAELADALRSGRSEQCAREGSNPSFGMKNPLPGFFILNNGLMVKFGCEKMGPVKIS